MSKKQDPNRLKTQTEKKEPNAVNKGNKKDKNISQHNILEAMRSQIDFLNIFTIPQIQFLFDSYDTIVFERGMVLGKEKQIIDYVGVILNGGAIGQKTKKKYKKNSFIGHGISLFGLESHKHPETVTAESEGIMLAVRVEVLLNPSKNQLEQHIKTKIFNFIAQQTLCQLKGEKQLRSNLQAQFQLIDEKLSQKFYQSNKALSSLIQSIADQKQRQKFIEEFPMHCAKQKTLVKSKNSKSTMVIVLKGELIAKYGFGLKKQTRIIETGSIYNVEGFIFDHNQFANIYCLSNQVVFLTVDKQRLQNYFKLQTFVGVMNFCLDFLAKNCEYDISSFLPKNQENMSSEDKSLWSPFKKPFNILQIPAKKEPVGKSTSSKQAKQTNKKDSINVFQTLYQTYSTSSKNKLKSKETQLTQYKHSQTSESAPKTIKTQYSVQEKTSQGTSNQKVKKLETQIMELKQQNLDLVNKIKKMKLDLLEIHSKLKMVEVFRQINNLKLRKEGQTQLEAKKVEGKSLTLKQAFNIHLKNKKLELFVAKCAYKWLSITRQNRNKRQNQSTSTLLVNSLKGAQI